MLTIAKKAFITPQKRFSGESWSVPFTRHHKDGRYPSTIIQARSIRGESRADYTISR